MGAPCGLVFGISAVSIPRRVLLHACGLGTDPGRRTCREYVPPHVPLPRFGLALLSTSQIVLGKHLPKEVRPGDLLVGANMAISISPRQPCGFRGERREIRMWWLFPEFWTTLPDPVGSCPRGIDGQVDRDWIRTITTGGSSNPTGIASGIPSGPRGQIPGSLPGASETTSMRSWTTASHRTASSDRKPPPIFVPRLARSERGVSNDWQSTRSTHGHHGPPDPQRRGRRRTGTRRRAKFQRSDGDKILGGAFAPGGTP